MPLRAQDRPPLIIAAGLAAGGLFIAVALFISRTSDVPGPSPAPVVAVSQAPAPAPSPVPASPTLDPATADALTQGNLNQVNTAALQGYAADGSFAAVTSVELAPLTPTLTYVQVGQPSLAADSISITNEELTFSAAALSGSGTCFWIKTSTSDVEQTPVTTFGSGLPCAGQTAQGASLPAWTP